MVFQRIFGRKVGKAGFGSSTTAEQVVAGTDLTGKVAVVTGAGSGIGVETARALSSKGAHTVLAVRNVQAGEETKADILKGSPKAQVDVMSLDLSSFESVRSFATRFEETKLPLNILVNNAGVMMAPFRKTKDGHELQFGTNHLGHFLLTDLLLDNLKRTAKKTGTEGRIVVLSSAAHQRAYREGIRFDKLDSPEGYNAFAAYGQSKLANVLHANELSRRLKAEGADVTVNAVHPGVIATKLFRHLPGFVLWGMNTIASPFFKTAQQGAATSVYVATHPSLKGVSGEYFADCNVAKKSTFGKDAAMGERLWQVSKELTAKK